jgi:hypothetical protein
MSARGVEMDHVVGASAQKGAQLESRPRVKRIANRQRIADDACRAGAPPQEPSRIAQQFGLMARAYQFQRQAKHLALAAGKTPFGIYAYDAKPL